MGKQALLTFNHLETAILWLSWVKSSAKKLLTGLCAVEVATPHTRDSPNCIFVMVKQGDGVNPLGNLSLRNPLA